MSIRPRQANLPSGMANDAIAAKLLELSMEESKRNAHHSMAAVTDVSAGECCKASVPTELHPSMHPPAGMSEADIDAWYDGVSKAVEKAKSGVKTLSKTVRDNTSTPEFVQIKASDGKTKISMPRALYIYYKDILVNLANPAMSGIVDNAFFPAWTSSPKGVRPGDNKKYTDGLPGAAGVKTYISELANQFNNLSWTTDAFYEAKLGDWIPAGVASGSRTFVHVGKVSGELKKEATPNILGVQRPKGKRFSDVLAIDVHTLVRDPKENGVWKIKHTYSAADWLSAVQQSESTAK